MLSGLNNNKSGELVFSNTDVRSKSSVQFIINITSRLDEMNLILESFGSLSESFAIVRINIIGEKNNGSFFLVKDGVKTFLTEFFDSWGFVFLGEVQNFGCLQILTTFGR